MQAFLRQVRQRFVASDITIIEILVIIAIIGVISAAALEGYRNRRLSQMPTYSRLRVEEKAGFRCLFVDNVLQTCAKIADPQSPSNQ